MGNRVRGVISFALVQTYKEKSIMRAGDDQKRLPVSGGAANFQSETPAQKDFLLNFALSETVLAQIKCTAAGGRVRLSRARSEGVMRMETTIQARGIFISCA